jgi:hypothetical protein
MKSSEGVISIVTAIIGVAMVAVIVQSANTSKVIGAFGSALSGSIRAAQGNIAR